MAHKYQENSDYSTSSTETIYGDNWAAQTFTPSISHAVTKVKLVLGKSGSPSDLTIVIKAVDGSGHPTGSDLATGTLAAANIPSTWSDTQPFISFDTAASLTADTKYAIVAKSISSDSSNYVRWYKETSDVYAGGNTERSTDGGSSWTAYSYDQAFEEWGVVGPPTDRVVIKKLVAAGDDGLKYEDSAGSMTLLSASDQDISTAESLTLFEAYQKVVVVNGANLKIADFINTKLDLGSGNELTNPPAKGDVLTQATSGASMIVDFVDSTKRYIYGYTTTSDSFNTSNTVSSDDGVATMSPATFTPSVVNEASTTPHWYDYTVYPDIVLSAAKYGAEAGAAYSFGTLPAKAYLGCLYRGRAVLAGNPDYPHQWYMSRQADIWDYAYLANDAQSPAVGNNTDAGEVGDIITALIPYKDDYLIFGCASSVWVLRGDPAAGGSLDEVDLTVGVFGANSWCFDGEGNLYFWGTNGIYVMSSGFGAVKCLTENTLPAIVTEEAADPSTHRITMGYDRKRRGVLVCITKLSDGANSNYWYDLRTGGFFPESYPTVCGVFSLFHYAANDKGYEDLLLGCSDGYIRKFDDAAKDDDSGASDTKINSYCTLPIQPLAPDGDHEGKLTSLTITTAGGAADGDFGDTDEVSYALYRGDDAETVLEDIVDGATAVESGALSGTGRKERVRKRVRGAYLGIKLYNSSADKTWAIEKVEGNIEPAGKLK